MSGMKRGDRITDLERSLKDANRRIDVLALHLEGEAERIDTLQQRLEDNKDAPEEYALPNKDVVQKWVVREGGEPRWLMVECELRFHETAFGSGHYYVEMYTRSGGAEATVPLANEMPAWALRELGLSIVSVLAPERLG